MSAAVAQAERLWAEGRHLNDLARFADAATALASARVLLGPLTGAPAQRIGIRVDITAALTHLELDGYAVAAQLLDGATRRATDLGAGDLLALSHIQHGVIDARSGRWEESSTRLRQVLPLFEHIGPVEQCSTLITLGLAELSLRRISEAVDVLGRARRLGQEHDLPVHLFKATHNLGCAAYVSGDLPLALSLMSEADNMPVDVARERARLDLATALLEAGLLDRAREALTTALDTARSTGHRLDEGDILLDLARCALLDDDRPLARRLAEAAGSAFAARQAQARQDVAELFIAGLDAADGQRLIEALQVAERWAGGDTPESVDAALVRAEAHLAQGHLQECASDLTPLRTTHTLLSRRLHELHVRARLAQYSGAAADFTAAALEASELTASAQGAMRSLEVRAALAQHAGPIGRLDHARALQVGAPADVFATIERWRAASRRGLLPAASEDRAQNALVAELRWLRSGVAPVADDDPARTSRRIAELEWAISAAAWRQGADPGHADQPVSIDGLRERLPPGGLYIAFTESADRCHALLVSDAAERLVELGSTSRLADAVATLRRDLRGAAHAYSRPALREVLAGAVSGSAATVDELLLVPLRAELEAHERFVLAPSALLHAVPWAALPSIEHRPVTVTPSATAWARHASAPAVPVGAVSAVTGPAVANAAEEAAAVAQVWRSAGTPVSTQPNAATASQTAAALSSADIVHIAAHGQHAEHSPMFSALVMADGPLFAHELSTGLRARHVVLSACDVGRSNVRAGGETLGLTAALLALGVQTVVAAIAPVPHEVAAAAALDYHRGLADGLDAATALARAIQATPGSEAWCAFGGELVVSEDR